MSDLPTAHDTAQDAVAFARHQVTNHSTSWHNMCLSFVRQSWGLPGYYATAADAWRGAHKRHAWTGHTADIPYGAPVFSHRPDASSTDAGHIFIAGGYNKNRTRLMRSTDINIYGGISVCTVEDIMSKWGHVILGWSEDLNGYHLNLPKPPNQK